MELEFFMAPFIDNDRWRKLKIIEDFPQIDQKAILHYIKTIAKNREADQKAK